MPYSDIVRKASRVLTAVAAALTAVLAMTSCSIGEPQNNATHSHTDPSLTPEANFASMMIPHHYQALEMAAYAKANAEDPQVLALAIQIYDSQAEEMEIMTEWLGDIEVPSDTHTEGMLTEAQMNELKLLTGRNFEKKFLELMIFHHEGAIDMARNYQDSKDPELNKMANEIIDAQSTEISLMKLMLK